MKRLIVGFYLAVVLILFCAWLIQAYLFSRAFRDAGEPFEDAFAGGLRAAKAIYEDSSGTPVAALAKVQTLFEHPVAVVPIAALPEDVRTRFSAGKDIAIYGGKGFNLAVLLSDQLHALTFGPIRTLRGPTQTEVIASMGVLLLFVAVAIAVLLRPISKQLRLLEETATAIAGGNFSRRVNQRKVPLARTLALALNDMAARTESLLNTQTEMLQAVSHELRTPLARINFAIDLLRGEVDEQQRSKRLDSLEAASLEMDRLVGELLNYVRWESNPPHVKQESVELNSVIAALSEKLHILHPAKTIALNASMANNSIAIRCDRIGLERVLGNVLGNALQHAQSDVAVDCRRTPTELLIDVDDDGPGIPAADRERVFDAFVRLEEGGRGAGLGLALVRRILRHVGGAVRALENPQGGCRIRIAIPIERVDGAPAAGLIDHAAIVTE